MTQFRIFAKYDNKNAPLAQDASSGYLNSDHELTRDEDEAELFDGDVVHKVIAAMYLDDEYSGIEEVRIERA